MCVGECVQACVWVSESVSGQVGILLVGVPRGVLNGKFRQLILNFVISVLIVFFIYCSLSKGWLIVW